MWTGPVGMRVSDPRPPHGNESRQTLPFVPATPANLVPSFACGSQLEVGTQVPWLFAHVIPHTCLSTGGQGVSLPEGG